jgi:anti-sigma regulatory factor (Ser/Thr protein kinase)
MPATRRQNPAIREFILRNVERHPGTIGGLVAKEFSVSRAAIGKYMQRLVEEGFLTAAGKTNARKYELAPITEFLDRIEIYPGLYEDDVWRNQVIPALKTEMIPANVIDICQYGFTEMLNNVIDHSGSKFCLISVAQTYSSIKMLIVDYGVGIFEKIKQDFNLPDLRNALLELSKGKLTSDKTKHSGEGIFFTSRMFDRFYLSSSNLYYRKTRLDGDDGWLIETETKEELEVGTQVGMQIRTDAPWTAKNVFDQYQDDDYRFAKTHVPLFLGRYGGEQLISRSQAKRVLARVERFQEVLLDFQGVEQIGQGFADEIFRVFKNEHPNIDLIAINAGPEVEKMIKHVTSGEV